MTTIERYQPPAGVEATRISPSTEVMTGLETTWCPGCGHGSFTQILADVIQEMGIAEQVVLCAGVGCGSPIILMLGVHAVNSPHGRASDVCTGIVRAQPESVVIQYSGDGDSCAIGLSGLMHACNRAENFLVMIYNNNVYGMTGGQMGPTTTKEVPTTTFQGGRDESVMGFPIDIIKTLAHFPGVAYAARCALTSGPRYVEARKIVRHAFEIHEAGVHGMKVIDALGNCNVNWKGGGVTFTPESANDFIEATIMPYFEMGELRLPDGYRPVPVK